MMPNTIAKQTITFQKTLFENGFKAVKMTQEQTEKIMDNFLSRMSWVPDEGKKAISTSVSFYKKACDDFKKSVDNGFEKMEALFVQ